MPLLIRPALATDEGLYGYICRLATRNSASNLFRSMLISPLEAMRSVPELASLSGEGIEALSRRGSYVQRPGRLGSGVRFGDVIVPRKVVRLRGRRVCPECLASDGTWRCVWQLVDYDVCDRHGLELIGTCCACKQRLVWSHPSSDQCACGFPLTKLEAKSGRKSRQKLCEILATSMLQTIHRSRTTSNAGGGAALPIDWTLILCEFMANVVIPVFGKQFKLNSLMRFRMERDALLVKMFEDVAYCSYLRESVFMYAASDPMTLVSTLRPGRSADWCTNRFGPQWKELSFHRSLWDFRHAHSCNVALRRTVAHSRTKPSTGSGAVSSSSKIARNTRRRSLHLENTDITALDNLRSRPVAEAVKLLEALRQEVPVHVPRSGEAFEGDPSMDAS